MEPQRRPPAAILAKRLGLNQPSGADAHAEAKCLPIAVLVKRRATQAAALAAKKPCIAPTIPDLPPQARSAAASAAVQCSGAPITSGRSAVAPREHSEAEAKRDTQILETLNKLLSNLTEFRTEFNIFKDDVTARLQVIEEQQQQQQATQQQQQATLEQLQRTQDESGRLLHVTVAKAENSRTTRLERLEVVPLNNGSNPVGDYPESLMNLMVAGNESLPDGRPNTWNRRKSRALLRQYCPGDDSDQSGGESDAEISEKSRAARLKLARRLGVTSVQLNYAQLSL